MQHVMCVCVQHEVVMCAACEVCMCAACEDVSYMQHIRGCDVFSI